MRNRTGYFSFESIVMATLVILVIATLSMFVNAARNPMILG